MTRSSTASSKLSPGGRGTSGNSGDMVTVLPGSSVGPSPTRPGGFTKYLDVSAPSKGFKAIGHTHTYEPAQPANYMPTSQLIDVQWQL